MKRIAACLLAFACGCDAGAPGVDAVEPFVAVSGYYSIMAAAQKPTPKPKPDSGVCETCHGSGVLGDGVQKLTCGDCGGTGKKKVSVLVPTSRPPVSTLRPPVTTIPCESGTCTTRTIVR